MLLCQLQAHIRTHPQLSDDERTAATKQGITAKKAPKMCSSCAISLREAVHVSTSKGWDNQNQYLKQMLRMDPHSSLKTALEMQQKLVTTVALEVPHNVEKSLKKSDVALFQFKAPPSPSAQSNRRFTNKLAALRPHCYNIRKTAKGPLDSKEDAALSALVSRACFKNKGPSCI